MLRWLGQDNPTRPIILTIPHSGETVPPEAEWLKSHSQALLLTDVDRYLDKLYAPAIEELELPALVTDVHRYAADLNRYPEDIDKDSVQGSNTPSGTFSKGFHWVKTTLDQPIMTQPISEQAHRALVEKYHDRFHEELAKRARAIRQKFPGQDLLHLDLHSMPSMGTGAHSDAGQRRPDVVISDYEGASSHPRFKDAVIASFQKQGFKTSYNWPYKGGRITQRCGKPGEGHHAIQIELNRALYMDESTKARAQWFDVVANQLVQALEGVLNKKDIWK